jgi:hypothetical protein
MCEPCRCRGDGPSIRQATTYPFIYRRVDGSFAFEVDTGRGVVSGSGFARQRDAIVSLVDRLVLECGGGRPRARC